MLLLLAGRVHSLDRNRPGSDPADAVLIDGDRIRAIGLASQLRVEAPHARVIDLGSATITPGLTDAHAHLTDWAFARLAADLRSAISPTAVVDAIRHHAETHTDRWIFGMGWNPHHWGGGYPDRHELDAGFPDRPVVLQSHDLHALWVNAAALRHAGIDRDTPDPPDGRIVRDDQGEATGILLENAAQIVSRAVPERTLARALEAVRSAQSELHTFGITGIHSFPGVHVVTPRVADVIDALRADGDLQLRILQHLPLDELDRAIAAGMRSGAGDDWVRTGAVKMFLDGALGSRTAWMRTPYEGSQECGMQVLDADSFADAVMRAAHAGIATTVHAIGDAAVDLALDVLATAPRVAALPHRIEHVQCCAPERLADAGRAGIVCSVQPCHLMSDWRAADRHWGARAANAYAFRSLASGGAVLAFGSDVPVEPVDPRLGLYAAIRRCDTARNPHGGWQPQECLDASAALHGYTTGAAHAAGRDDLGRLVPGALADLVAWDIDPLAAEPEALLDMNCIFTMIGGIAVMHSD